MSTKKEADEFIDDIDLCIRYLESLKGNAITVKLWGDDETTYDINNSLITRTRRNIHDILNSANSELKEYYLGMCDGLTEADFNRLWEEHMEEDNA